MPTKKLVRDGLAITDEQRIKNQVQEKKDTGSFQSGVQLEDINPNAPKTPTTQIGQGTQAQNITDAPSLAKTVGVEPGKLDLPETQPLPKIDTFDSIDPKTGQKFNTDGTPFQEPTQTDGFIDKGNQQIQQADELKDKALEDLKVERDKAVEDTKRGFALGKAKFDENKANYTNYQEVNTKYNAVIDEITSNMSDTGVVDESVYQSIANKYGLTIEQVKNPNRILDKAELTEEGKENLGVNNFEQGIEESTKDFERTREDLQNRITQTQQAYNLQIEDAQRSITDAISGATTSGAASGLFRSTALQDSLNRTREDGARIIGRIQNTKERNVADITTSLSRITEDFESSISEARKGFEENFKEVNVENMIALGEAGLNLTGDKLTKALNDIEEEFGIKSQAVFQSYMNNLTAINSAVNENMDLVERIADQEEEKELKTYNEYLANDGLLLQSSTLSDIIRGVQEGKITPESAQNLRKIMQTSIQAHLGAIAPLELGDIDNINYLLENGYTPEQAIALMQESFDKFTPQEEISYREFDGNLYKETATGLELVQKGAVSQDGAWARLDDGTLYNKNTGVVKNISAGGGYTGSLGNGNITGYGGGYDNNEGLDIDGAIGDPITFPEELEVVFSGPDGDYGNSIKVKRANGDILRFSHNDEMYFKAGDTIPANEVFATVGNTGNVIAGEGGDGSHIDLVIERADGTKLKSRQVEQYLNSIKTADATQVSEGDEPISDVSSLTQGIISGIGTLKDLTPTDRKEVISEIVEAKKTGEYKAQFSAYADRKSERIVAGIDEALELLEFADGPAPLRAFMAKFPGTDADDFKRSIETIQANLGFDELQAMRAASPTGGALGQVSERELSALQSVQGNIEFDQSAHILKRRLQDIKESTIAWANSVKGEESTQEEDNPENKEEVKASNGKTYTIKVKK